MVKSTLSEYEAFNSPVLKNICLLHEGVGAVFPFRPSDFEKKKRVLFQHQFISICFLTYKIEGII
jgi:hypothetical protein